VFALTYGFIDANRVRLELRPDRRHCSRWRGCAVDIRRTPGAPAHPDARSVAVQRPDVQRREHVSFCMQNALGYSQVETGRLSALTVLLSLVAPRAGKTLRPLRLACPDHGRQDADLDHARLLLAALHSRVFLGSATGLTIGGTGLAMVITPTTAASMRAVPVARAGSQQWESARCARSAARWASRSSRWHVQIAPPR